VLVDQADLEPRDGALRGALDESGAEDAFSEQALELLQKRFFQITILRSKENEQVHRREERDSLGGDFLRGRCKFGRTTPLNCKLRL